MSKNIDRMKKALTEKKEPEGKKSSQRGTAASDMIKGMRKKESKKNEYSQFRMKTEVLDKMKAIADRENAVWPGQLIHTVLGNFIAKYEEENNIQL